MGRETTRKRLGPAFPPCRIRNLRVPRVSDIERRFTQRLLSILSISRSAAYRFHESGAVFFYLFPSYTNGRRGNFLPFYGKYKRPQWRSLVAATKAAFPIILCFVETRRKLSVRSNFPKLSMLEQRLLVPFNFSIYSLDYFLIN